MWSEGGSWEGMRLKHAVRTRLMAVLDWDCPALEPSVREVLEQRLDSAVRDLMELFQRSLDPGHVVQKQEECCSKEEPDGVGGASVSELMVVCVKSEEEEQEIEAGPEPLPSSPQDRDPDLDPDSQDGTWTWTHLYCPQCGSTVQTPILQSGAQPRCSFCGQSLGRDTLLLEHSYGRERPRAPGRAGFSCCLCAEDFGHQGALLDHMTQHLSAPGGPRFNSQEEGWSFQDDEDDDRSCSFCGSLFRDSEQLQEHMREHLP